GRHILLVRPRNLSLPGARDGIGTLLVSRDPFTAEDLAAARSACETVRCDVAWSWEESVDPNFAVLLRTEDPAALRRAFPLDVSPPTDDRPYFFFHAQALDVLAGREARPYGASMFNLHATRVLVTLTLLVLVL